MAGRAKVIAQAVRAYFESLEDRRYLFTVTLSASGGNNAFFAQLNTATNKVDFYLDGTPGNGTPVQSVAAADVQTVEIHDTSASTDTFTWNVTGQAVNLDAAYASGLSLYAAKGSVSLANTQTLGGIDVGSGGMATVESTGTLLAASSVVVDGRFELNGGLLNTSTVVIDAGGTFVGGDGTLAHDGGVTINNSGTYEAKSDGTLAGTTGTFNDAGLFIEDVGAGATNTIGMTFSNNGASFDLLSGTVHILSDIISAAPFQLDGTGGTLEIPSYNTGSGAITQTGGTFTVDGMLWVGNYMSTGGTYTIHGGTLNAGAVNVGAWGVSSVLQTGGTVNVSGAVSIGYPTYGTWTQTGGNAVWGSLGMSGSTDGTPSVLNLSGGSLTTSSVVTGFNGQTFINVSQSGAFNVTGQANLGAWGGTTTINQSGGAVNINDLHLGSAYQGTGIYNLSAGTLDAGDEYLTKDADVATDATYGTIHQTGGTNRTNWLDMGVGFYGNAVYTLDGGVLDAGWLIEGAHGATATFTQTAGQITASQFFVGDMGTAVSTFSLIGGTVHVINNAYVGHDAIGHYVQSGGAMHIDGSLVVSGDTVDGDVPDGHGSVALSGTGSLSSTNTFVGYGSDGSFTQTGGTQATGYFLYNGPGGSVGTYSATGGTRAIVHLINVLTPTASGDASVDEGSPYTLGLAATSDVGANAISQWQVAWGDTTSDTLAGTATSATHVYPTGGTSVVVNAVASGGGRNYPSLPVDVLVRDVPARITSGTDVTTDAGQPANVFVTFADPGADETHSASIAWGDGTSSTSTDPNGGITLLQNGHTGTIAASHAYLTDGDHTAYLTVVDSAGEQSVMPITVHVNYVPPTLGVSAESASVAAGQQTKLDLTATGAEAAGVTSWTVDWGDNTAVTTDAQLVQRTSVSSQWATTHQYTHSGTYTVHARAVDAHGTRDAAAVQVTVTIAGPTIVSPATANPNVVTGNTTTLSVLGDENGGEANLTYHWSSSGPAAVAFSGTPDTNLAKQVTATFTTDGVYTFTATATDADGLTVTSLPVTVTVAKDTSDLIVGPASGIEGRRIDLLTHAPLATGEQYVWSATSNGGPVGSGTGPTFRFVPSNSGLYTVTLYAVSDNGKSRQVAMRDITVRVSPPTDATITGPDTVQATIGTTFQGAATAVAEDEGKLRYQWEVFDASGNAVATPSNFLTGLPSFVFDPPSVGIYSVKLTVSDQEGYSTSVTNTVTAIAAKQSIISFNDFDNSWNADEVGSVVLPDHSTLVASIEYKKTYPNIEAHYVVTRYKSDLSLDSSFGGGGRLVINLPKGHDDFPYLFLEKRDELESGRQIQIKLGDLTLQTIDKATYAVLGGVGMISESSQPAPNDYDRMGIFLARFSVDSGAMDLAFGDQATKTGTTLIDVTDPDYRPAGRLNGDPVAILRDMEIDAHNRIVFTGQVGGFGQTTPQSIKYVQSKSIDSYNAILLGRLLPDGQVDHSFGNEASDHSRSGFTFTAVGYSGYEQSPTYGIGSESVSAADSLSINQDGEIVVGGWTQLNYYGMLPIVAFYTRDGMLDTAQGGESPDPQTQGGYYPKYVQKGVTIVDLPSLYGQNIYGSGTSEGGDGPFVIKKVQWSGKNIIALAQLVAVDHRPGQDQYIHQYDTTLVARLDGGTGVLDNSFGTGGLAVLSQVQVASYGQTFNVDDFAVQSDGGILVAGSMYSIDANADHINATVTLARVNAYGIVDNDFGFRYIPISHNPLAGDPEFEEAGPFDFPASILLDGAAVVIVGISDWGCKQPATNLPVTSPFFGTRFRSVGRRP